MGQIVFKINSSCVEQSLGLNSEAFFAMGKLNAHTLKFSESCYDIRKVDCAIGSFHINPCSCYTFYKCVAGPDVIRQPCANGTAFDHLSSNNPCAGVNDIILTGLCKENAPWERCNASSSGWYNMIIHVYFLELFSLSVF